MLIYALEIILSPYVKSKLKPFNFLRDALTLDYQQVLHKFYRHQD